MKKDWEKREKGIWRECGEYRNRPCMKVHSFEEFMERRYEWEERRFWPNKRRTKERIEGQRNLDIVEEMAPYHSEAKWGEEKTMSQTSSFLGCFGMKVLDQILGFYSFPNAISKFGRCPTILCNWETFKSSTPNHWQFVSWTILVNSDTLKSSYSDLCHSCIETLLLWITVIEKNIDFHRYCYKKKK